MRAPDKVMTRIGHGGARGYHAASALDQTWMRASAALHLHLCDRRALRAGWLGEDGGVLEQWQVHGDGGALAYSAVDSHHATVTLDRVADTHQSNARARNRRRHVAGTIVLLEQMRQVRSGYAEPTVDDLDTQPQALWRHHTGHGDHDWPALGTVLDGVDD